MKARTEQLGRSPAATRFRVPAAEEWPQLRKAAEAHVRKLGIHPPVALEDLETAAEELLVCTSLGPAYREFLMVLVNNALWWDVVRSVPMARRTLLLPPCLRGAECPAAFDEYGLMCEGCGGCCIGHLVELGEALGYAVLVAEGTRVVASLLERGAIDAVIGVSCMPSLERTFRQMTEQCVPGLAFPLLRDGCKNTEVPISVIVEAIQLEPQTGHHAALLDIRALRKTVEGWFGTDRLVEALHPHDSAVDRISLEWLSRDGKRWRPVLTVGLFQAYVGGNSRQIPDAVRRVGIALECIHKGSLIYDDIQDADDQRYGSETVHELHGVPMAMTASLQLIGMGYRLIAECGSAPGVVQRMLALATRGHVDLCVGQGTDVGWLSAPRLLSSDDVLELFRWKTAPSFEVVFVLGAILAGASRADETRIREFSLLVGVAYQIRDDLEDWTGDGDVDDIRMCRPCLMTALACEMAVGRERKMVEQAWLTGNTAMAAEIRSVIQRTGVESRARELLAGYRTRALAAIRELECRDAKIFLHRLVWRMLA